MMSSFPGDCPECCARGEAELYRCYSCARRYMLPLPATVCPRCSQAMRNGKCMSEGCARGYNHFSNVYALGSLAGTLQGGITRLKDARVRCMAEPLGMLLSGYILERLDELSRYSWFMPIPKHPSRVAERGFDPVSEIFAVSRRYLQSRIRMIDSTTGAYLTQNRAVPSLRHETHSLDERYVAVRGSFSVQRQGMSFRGESVLLFDDVLTSGATLSAAADALLAVGAARVDGIVLARTQERGGATHSAHYV